MYLRILLIYIIILIEKNYKKNKKQKNKIINYKEKKL